jgi:hypothetical protein
VSPAKAAQKPTAAMSMRLSDASSGTGR